MRQIVLLCVMVGLAVSGCARGKHRAPTFSPPGQGTGNSSSGKNLIVTPETGLTGKVMSVNFAGRFAVLNFPIGHLPALEQRLNVYRLGLKTGEIKVTGPQQDDNIVGDVVAGDVRPGDEVRDR